MMRRALVPLLLPAALAAQAPKLTPLPVADALKEIDFKAAAALAIERSGCIALFDTDDGRVVCIDPASGAMRTVGTKGSGPGEFRLVSALAAVDGGGLVAYDAQNARYVSISPAWKVLRTAVAPISLGIYQATADSVLAMTVPMGKDATSDLTMVSLANGKTARRFVPTQVDSTGKFKDPNVPIGPFATGIVARKAGGWYIPTPLEYTIFVADAKGVKKGVITRTGLPPEMLTDAEKAAVEKLVAPQMAQMNAEQKKAVRAMIDPILKRPKPAIVSTAIAEDAAGRLWVGTSRLRRDSTEVDVFSPQGRLLGTVRVPGKLGVLRARGNELVGLVEWTTGDAEGMQGVVRYRTP